MSAPKLTATEQNSSVVTLTWLLKLKVETISTITNLVDRGLSVQEKGVRTLCARVVTSGSIISLGILGKDSKASTLRT